MANRQLVLPEVVVEGHRLGRHIDHSDASIPYRVGVESSPVTITWQRRIAMLDQLNLGSCTGNATVACLGCEPFFSSLPTSVQLTLDEKLAVAIYSGGTKRDDVDGAYPPQDTGSTGLAVAQEAKARGLISGYQHIMSLGEAFTAIASGPFIFGGPWMSGMDNPDSNGLVKPTGSVRGGHEWLFRGHDANVGLWLCDNSWGTSFGKGGSFYLSDASFSWLLSQQGDATPFVPITKPAPVPVPPTPPAPPEPTDPAYRAWMADVEADYQVWLKHPVLGKSKFAAAIKAWKANVD